MALSSETPHFPTTSWTLISRVKSGDPAIASVALGEILTHYRYPLYCYLRRRGLSHHDAEDVLHDFIASFLRRNSFASADEARGRLRGFLAASLSRHLARWHGRRSSQPGVGAGPTFDASTLEALYARERIPEHDTPDAIFERKWALALLHTVLDRLGSAYAARGKAELFAALRPVLLAGGSLRGHDTSFLASSLGLTPEALRTAHHRLLGEFRDRLRAEVAQTVESTAAIDAELDHLRRLFAAG